MAFLAHYKYLAVLLHVLSVVIWVGGMFFAYVVLRPVAATTLEPPQRLTLWVNVFQRFFPFVWVAVITLPLTGVWLIYVFWQGSPLPIYVHIMTGLAVAMILIYLHVYFAPFRRLKNAVAIQNWQEGGKRLGQMRKLIGINLTIGLINVIIASGGRLF
jgi:uncharacterized membrane protein